MSTSAESIEKVKGILKEVERIISDDMDRVRLVKEALQTESKYTLSVIIIKLLRRTVEPEVTKLLIEAHLLLEG